MDKERNEENNNNNNINKKRSKNNKFPNNVWGDLNIVDAPVLKNKHFF